MKVKRCEKKIRHAATRVLEKYTLSEFEAAQLTPLRRKAVLDKTYRILRADQHETHHLPIQPQRRRKPLSCTQPFLHGVPLWSPAQDCHWLGHLLSHHSLPAVILVVAALVCSYATTAGIDGGLHHAYSWRVFLSILNYMSLFLAQTALGLSLGVIVLALLRNLRPRGYLPR